MQLELQTKFFSKCFGNSFGTRGRYHVVVRLWHINVSERRPECAELAILRWRLPISTTGRKSLRFPMRSKKKRHCDLRVQISIAGDCDLSLRNAGENRTLAAEFPCNLTPAKENRCDCDLRILVHSEEGSERVHNGGRCLPTSAWWPLETPLARFRVRKVCLRACAPCLR